jgi:hypothetical protein
MVVLVNKILTLLHGLKKIVLPIYPMTLKVLGLLGRITVFEALQSAAVVALCVVLPHRDGLFSLSVDRCGWHLVAHKI